MIDSKSDMMDVIIQEKPQSKADGPDHGMHYRKMGKQAGIILFGQLVGKFIIRFGRTILIARTLGPSNWGIFGLLSTLPELIVSVGNIGLGPAIPYYISKEKRDPKIIMGTIIFYTLLLGPLLVIAGVILLKFDFIFKDSKIIINHYSILILIAIPFFFLKILILNYLMAQSKANYLALLGIIESALPLVLFLLLWYVIHDSLRAAAWSWFIASVAVSGLGLLIAFLCGGYPPKISRSSLTESISYGFKVFWSQCFQLALLRSDYLFISSMCGMKELGLYIIATRTAEILLSLTESLIAPFVPILFGMDKKDSNRFTPAIVKFVFWAMFVISSLLILGGQTVILLLFGNDFKLAYPSFLLLLPGMIAFSIFPFLKFDLFGRNQTLKVSYYTSIGFVINIVFNFVLIPKLGINGAAISSSVAYCMSTLFLILLYCKISGNTISTVFIISSHERRVIFSRISSRLSTMTGKS